MEHLASETQDDLISVSPSLARRGFVGWHRSTGKSECLPNLTTAYLEPEWESLVVHGYARPRAMAQLRRESVSQKNHLGSAGLMQRGKLTELLLHEHALLWCTC